MLFNSINFTLFLPVCFFCYWFIFKNNLKAQNIFLLISSYFFYACWDWRFLFLLIFSTLLDYYTGQKIASSTSLGKRKTWLTISVVVNLGFLAYFKYFNFFISSFSAFLAQFGLTSSQSTLNIILPIGISFYTFHGLSYVFDIYNKRISASNNIVNYSLFVSFFPLLVAGPIERATHLLPQIEKPRKFLNADATDGLRQILWGLFKKLVIADNCADYANMVFSNPEDHSGSTLFLGAILFTFQIYGDFSGYSDMALGIARLFGFELLRNFSYPYFSRDIAEFWRKWHISLSSWFKDYLYFPLGGSRAGKWRSIRNTMIIFVVSGFWHGANWTFIIWGFYHGLLFLPLLLKDKNRSNTNLISEGKLIPTVREFCQMSSTFILVTFGWIIFRSENIHQAYIYFRNMFSTSIFSVPYHTGFHSTLLLVSIMILAEWIQRDKLHTLEINTKQWHIIRWALYITIFLLCVGNFRQDQEFIYFQF